VQSESFQTVNEGRRYRITGVLGRGGFGTVYRATLEGADGFVKDVAIKILHDEDPPRDVLTRFRDEARILGQIRNPHIVGIDAPTRLGGRWAVVMEYVDGRSCAHLLKHGGPFPPSAALEITEQVCGTLDALYTHPGANGEPLQLLHRDLKPGNLQLTPNGHLKLLDFGIAKASFARRETTTTSHIGGTIGYIAPERLDGVEGPKGDVYSMGVVLHQLVTGRRPSLETDEPPPDDPGIRRAVELASWMRSVSPDERPDAAEVEGVAAHIRREIGGPSLRDWARTAVTDPTSVVDDDMVGQTFMEATGSIRMSIEPSARIERSGRWRWVAALVLVVVPLVVGTSLGVGSAGLGLWFMARPPAPSSAPAGFEAPPVPLPPPGPAAEGPDPGAAPEPAPTAPEAAPPPAEPAPPQPAPSSPTPRPRDPGSEAPVPAPAPPSPSPEPDDADDPAEPSPAVGGQVAFTGDAVSVMLEGSDGVRHGPGSVAAGTYDVLATFDSSPLRPVGRVTVPSGGAVTVRCQSRFRRCMAQ